MNDQNQNENETLCISNNFSETDRLHAFWYSFAERCGLDDEIRDDLRLAIEETFSNIVNHGYDGSKHDTIEIDFLCTADSISLRFTDRGIAFDPLSRDAEDDATGDRCDGGMGIQLIRSLTDEQDYRRIKQQNVFTVTKHCTKVSG